MQYKIINGAVYYDGEMVLENIDFEINDNEKIAVVGRNGCGKSTLLKAIMGEVELEEGTGENSFNVVRAGRPNIGYLKQIPFDDENTPMLEEVRKVFHPLMDMEARMERLVKELETSGDEKKVNEYTTLHERYIFLGGLTYKKEYMTMIRSFGFSEEDERKPVSEFSGGQRTKIAFMKLLLSRPDILLLDEPTNHLDIETIRWLEGYLKSYRSSLVIVSHDRMFLDRIVDKVYEIEYGETRCYKGNYSEFEKQKRENHIKQQKDHEAQQAEIQRLTRLIERFRYKATKAKMVQSKIKLLEHMQKIDAPDRYDLRTYHARFEPNVQSSKQVLTVNHLVVGYDKPLAEVNFELQRGQKLGIIGGNGIGKSTLLKTLMGEVEPLSGNYVFGYHTETGYFDQQLAQISGDETLFESFSNEYPGMNDTEVRSALGAFMFSGEDVFRQTSTLSGGEKVRLALCKILHHRPNVLLLDEPTNHMDIVGKETLESILADYEGTLIFVTHDRYFVNKIADRLLVFENGGAKFYADTYSEYEQRQALADADTSATENGAAEEKPAQKKDYVPPIKRKAKLERRLERLEQLMEESDAELRKLNDMMESPEYFSDYGKVAELEKKITAENGKQSEYMEEWESIVDELENMTI